MNKVAIIPARGGSKRIPHKNIKPFAGKPIIAWSIDAARTSGLFNRIIVSTDDREIAAVAEKFGAEVPFLRPAELANDFAGTKDVIKHCLQWLAQQTYPVAYACCIYPTAPFLQVEYLQRGYENLVATNSSFAFSVTSFSFPIQRAIRINKDGRIEAINPENIPVRSQDLEEAYHDAGQFYWGTREAFLDDSVMFSPVSVPVVLPRPLVQDIDTLEDWHRAELMFAALQNDPEVSL